MLRCTDQRARYRKLGNVMCVLTAAENLEEHVNQATESCRMFPEVWLMGQDPCEIASGLATVVYTLAPAIGFLYLYLHGYPQWLLLIDSDWQLHIQIRVIQRSMCAYSCTRYVFY